MGLGSRVDAKRDVTFAGEQVYADENPTRYNESGLGACAASQTAAGAVEPPVGKGILGRPASREEVDGWAVFLLWRADLTGSREQTCQVLVGPSKAMPRGVRFDER